MSWCPQCARYAAEMVDLVSQIAAHAQAYKVAVEERDMWQSTAKHEIEQTTLARRERDRALEDAQQAVIQDQPGREEAK